MSDEIDIFSSGLPSLTEPQREMALSVLAGLMGGASGKSHSALDIPSSDSNRPQLRFPELKCRQRSTTDDRVPGETEVGDLFLTTGDVAPMPFKGLILAMWEENTLFDPEENSVSCKSLDTRVGFRGECKDCPDKPWRDGVLQACKNSLVALIMDPDMGISQVRFSGSSYASGKKLTYALSSRPKPWSKYIYLETEKQRGKKGEYHRLMFKNSSEAPSEDVETIADSLSAELVKARQRAIEEFKDRYLNISEPSNTSGTTSTTKGGVKTLSVEEDPSYEEEL